jgi:hypothetical protein
MSLIDYWPSGAEVNACIKPEAEGASEAVLIAVHQPTPLVYRLANRDEQVPATEDELLTHFLSRDVPTGAHIVPITGDSGVGKSHLVRWLAARLKSLPDADRFVIVRIPKSASLRRVVQLIIELLPAQSYDEVREAFQNALADVNPATAAGRFQSALGDCLEDLSKDLVAQLRANATDASLRERLHHSQRLPLLLSDAVTRDHFRSGVITRLVQRAVAGRTATEEEPEQFLPTDLDLPDTIDLAKSSEAVRLYYRTALQARGGYGKTVAATVLNDVMDAAIRQSFHLNESLGGMTLQDVILEIRTLLLRDGRELVILVEDFRALTGIQETLLNVLIQEGVRDGAQVYATMRSAIAVTEGYLTGRDTIATRAAREWIIKSHLEDDEEVLQRTRSLVASYLNAARWGEQALERQRARSTSAGRGEDPNTPPFDGDASDGVRNTLAAFGRISGVPLFPLTPAAIEYFSRRALQQGNELVFRPRAIIQFLREVLLFGRDAFASGEFPPPSIKSYLQPAQDVAGWLSRQHLSSEQRDRYARIVVIWGNYPQRPADISRIPSEVFGAFSLPQPQDISVDPAPHPPSTKPLSPQPAPPPLADERKLAEVERFRKELESWIQQDGPLLSQEAAREIRNGLSAALNHRIDWNGERCRDIDIRSVHIDIPHSRGSRADSPGPIPVANDRADPDGQLRAELLALLRFYSVWKRDMTYLEVEDDLARVGNLVDRVLPAARSFVRDTAQSRARSACALLADNSRLAGITDFGRTPGAVKSFLFNAPEELPELPPDAPDAFVHWMDTRRKAVAIRGSLTQALLESCGCYQGAGSSANGVDIMRVVEALSEGRRPTDNDNDLFDKDVRERLRELTELRVNARAKAAAVEARRLKSELDTKLGQQFDKHELTNSVLELAEELRVQGAWPANDLGLSVEAFKTVCEDFRSCPLKAAFEQLAKIQNAEGPEDTPDFIANVAKVNFAPVVVAARFAMLAERVVDFGNRYAKSTEDQYHDVRPDMHIQNLQEEFDDVLADLTDIQG